MSCLMNWRIFFINEWWKGKTHTTAWSGFTSSLVGTVKEYPWTHTLLHTVYSLCINSYMDAAKHDKKNNVWSQILVTSSPRSSMNLKDLIDHWMYVTQTPGNICGHVAAEMNWPLAIRVARKPARDHVLVTVLMTTGQLRRPHGGK